MCTKHVWVASSCGNHQQQHSGYSLFTNPICQNQNQTNKHRYIGAAFVDPVSKKPRTGKLGGLVVTLVAVDGEGQERARFDNGMSVGRLSACLTMISNAAIPRFAVIEPAPSKVSAPCPTFPTTHYPGRPWSGIYYFQSMELPEPGLWTFRLYAREGVAAAAPPAAVAEASAKKGKKDGGKAKTAAAASRKKKEAATAAAAAAAAAAGQPSVQGQYAYVFVGTTDRAGAEAAAAEAGVSLGLAVAPRIASDYAGPRGFHRKVRACAVLCCAASHVTSCHVITALLCV